MNKVIGIYVALILSVFVFYHCLINRHEISHELSMLMLTKQEVRMVQQEELEFRIITNNFNSFSARMTFLKYMASKEIIDYEKRLIKLGFYESLKDR